MPGLPALSLLHLLSYLLLPQPIPCNLGEVPHEQFSAFFISTEEEHLSYLGLVMQVAKIFIGQSRSREYFDRMRGWSLIQHEAESLDGGEDLHAELSAEVVVADLVFGVVDTTIYPVVADVRTPCLQLKWRVEVSEVLGSGARSRRGGGGRLFFWFGRVIAHIFYIIYAPALHSRQIYLDR